MRNIIRHGILTLVLFSFFAAPVALAQNVPSIYDQANQGSQAVGGELFGKTIQKGTPPPFIARMFIIVNYLLNFLAILAFLLLLYAGYEWMLARGNEEQISKAKKIIREVIIGLIIIAISRIFTEFILAQIGGAIQ